jgi:hypothetical protein
MKPEESIMSVIVRKTYCLPVSGTVVTYELERKWVKNINMRVRRDGSIYISTPGGSSMGRAIAQAESFLREREDWLLGAMERARQMESSHPDLTDLVLGPSLPYLGGHIRMVFQSAPLTAPPQRQKPGQGQFDFDQKAGVLTCTLSNPSDTEWRLTTVEAFERDQTRQLVMQFVNQHGPALARRGAPYPPSVRIRRMTSRYGSCSAQNGSINFNLRLCEYPLPFIEYVVVHELCHFLHQDHSPAFYQEVAAILPDFKEREKLVKSTTA